MKARNAELKFQRAVNNDDGVDPISGYDVEEIGTYLATAAVGLNQEYDEDILVAGAICRRNGISF